MTARIDAEEEEDEEEGEERRQLDDGNGSTVELNSDEKKGQSWYLETHPASANIADQ